MSKTDRAAEPVCLETDKMPMFAGSHIFSYSKKKINTLHFLHYKQTDQNTSNTAYYCNKQRERT